MKLLQMTVTHFSTLPSSLVVMVLRLTCNLFSNDIAKDNGAKFLLSESCAMDQQTSHRAVTTSLLIESLLSKEVAVRCAGASLGYNISTIIKRNRDLHEQASSQDEWALEVLVALVKAYESEQDLETRKSCS